MSLGLSHSLARHKLKFSPDKIDTMIVQAIALLDDLDKELNTYAMRVKEWYGWHFPELAKILNDNLAYAKVVLKMGFRTDFEKADLAEVLPEEIEAAVKGAADRSMGTEITQEDLDNIQALAEQVVSFTEYRQQLSSYLTARMTAIAPNLTALVGELVGARLIAHAGSLMNLSKSPASTIQILGAEKALFRALKTKHDTPKYGLIYHASLVGQATGKNKGKMARVLAAKTAIGLRVDALQDWGEVEPDEEERAALGNSSRYKLERKLAGMEGRPMRPKGVAVAPNGAASTQPGKWEIKEARKYNPDADGLAGDEPAAAAPLEKKSKKERKKLVEEIKEKDDSEDAPMAEPESEGSESDDESEADDTEMAEAPVVEKPSKVTTNGHLTNGEAKDKKKRKEEKKEKKEKKAEKSGSSTDNIESQAKLAGLSVERYKRKLERGEITFGADGTPSAISKKDIKKAKKAEKKGAAADESGKKRKRSAEDGAEVESKSDKKKKKKSKA